MDYPKLKRLALNDEGFIFDPLTGNSFVANATAQVALQVIREGGGIAGAAAKICQDFDVSPEQAEEDLRELLAQLSLEKLV
ncbi:MAG: PqqD family peptide modification chaperone [bacterium]|nr:PqqD family peptide modification chaperone [bacterium]